MSDLNTGGNEMQARHLDRVRDLIQATETAIAGLERNNLQEFQTALREQEALCAELAAIKKTCVLESETQADTELTAKLQSLYKELAQVNRVYAGVVKRAKRCTDLLLRLYGMQQYGQPLSSSAEQQTLSCEV